MQCRCTLLTDGSDEPGKLLETPRSLNAQGCANLNTLKRPVSTRFEGIISYSQLLVSEVIC